MTWNGESFDVSQLDAWVGILTALGTLLAVVVAVGVAFREHRARVAADARSRLLEERDQERERRELERLRTLEEREVRAQAARVTVLTEPNVGGFLVRNASDMPIFGARIHGMVQSVDIRFLDSDGNLTEAMQVGESEAADIGPGQSEGFVISQWETLEQYVSSFAVRFRDANDVAWLRAGTGHLDRIPDDPEQAERLVNERLRAPWAARAQAEADRRAHFEELDRLRAEARERKTDPPSVD